MRYASGLTGNVCTFLFLLPFAAHAGPLYLEEQAKIPSPDQRYDLGTPALTLGAGVDHIAIPGVRLEPENFLRHEIVFLFERNHATGSWQHIGQLYEEQADDTIFYPLTVAAEDNVIAISAASPSGRTGIFEFTPATGWARVSGFPGNANALGRDSEIEDGTIIRARDGGFWGAAAYRKNAAGQWEFIGQSGVTIGTSDDEFYGRDVDISGDTMLVAAPFSDDDETVAPGQAEVFERSGTSWPRTAVLRYPAGAEINFADAVAIEGDTAIVAGDFRNIVSRLAEFRRTSGGWSYVGDVMPADAFQAGLTRSIELQGGLLTVNYADDAQRGPFTGSVAVFKRDAAGGFEEVARLVASDSDPNRGLHFTHEIEGRSVIVNGSGGGTHGGYVFQLPADLSQPATRQDDFEDGNSGGWTPLAGSTWSVVSSGGSRVYRQTRFGALDGSLLGDTDWTNQSIEADVKPTAVEGTDRWVGLAVRYTDPGNYYYLTLRQSNVVQIRRFLNGSFQAVASAPQTFRLGRTYRLRLEAVGTWIRAYVDGKLVLTYRDDTLSHGQAGLLMSRARADVDNVIVSPNPSVTLLAENFEGDAARWSPGLTSDWVLTNDGSSVYAQRSTAGDARSVSGVSTRDQIIQARAKATSFAPGGERWFGLMTRFVDDQNYYYVTVRNTNQISLRALVNGAIRVLDTAPMTVSTGTWYTLRMEAVGASLRVYVNNRLVLEAADSTHAQGRYGFRTFRTAARYDDFTAVKP